MNFLVIDDDMPTVDVILKSIDWDQFGAGHVYSCYNISTAKEYFKNEGIDIAVCDIEMPMGSGLDLLIWARESGYETQFIFLTSHERFDYANTAIRYKASGYVVKPFNREMMEEELRKAIMNVRQIATLAQAADQEEWFRSAKTYVEAGFWRELFENQIPADRKAIEEQISIRHLDINAMDSVMLALIDSGHLDVLEEKWGDAGLYEEELSKITVNVFCEKFRQERFFSAHIEGTGFSAAVISGKENPAEVYEKCMQLCHEAESILKHSITIYLGTICQLWELSETGRVLLNMARNNVAQKGKAFHQEDRISTPQGDHLLDPAKIRDLLLSKQAKGLLDYCRFQMEHAAAGGRIDQAVLREVRQDLWQSVCVFLDGHNIQTRQLFSTPAYEVLEKRATDSVMDMMRWQMNIVTKSIQYVEEIGKSDSIVSRAKAFVHDHYTEDISRTEVAASLFLNPEYMAKIFKKETGISIKQYITDYRMEKAKGLLAAGDVRISEVAQQVGIDNFSYFSTLFRKATGLTPVEYHNRIVNS
ncbi:MAG: helix-turn-helix domain-containing protein [Lachnospiraceae bacterium]|nr:helix-turn-helix domain-containing protein [Lachnospiraceae bacterium]